jgi:predicted Zn-dependent protease
VLALIRSFRRLSAAEAAQLRPRIVRVVQVGPADTASTLISRMADSTPAALFELLNGKSTSQPLRPGERVKLVTYDEES